MTMRPISARTLSLIGFAASEWASAQMTGSRHRRRYRQLITAGLHLHEHGELYAAAPRLEAALHQVIDDASKAVR
jgi:hypothetical protein